MMNKLIRFSVYHPSAILALTLLAGLVGWFSFQSLPIDAVPDITNVQVQVNTPVEGLAPEEIERSITFPVETAMSGIAGVEQVRSITRFGLSQVTVVFEDQIDIYRARQVVSERLQSVAGDLPTGAKPSLGPVTTGLGEIFHYTVEADKIETGEARLKQLMDLRAIQEWFIKPRLLTVKGVAEVNTIGGYEKQFHIQPIPKKLVKYGLHFGDIEEALAKTNQNVGGGYIQQTGEQFLVQAVGLLRSVEDIKAVPVKSLETFTTLTIGDLADVGLGKELRTGAALIGGKEAILGTVLMLLGENSRVVSTRVAERMKEIEKTLPAGIKIKNLYDRSTLVNATLNTITHNLVLGAVLVMVILLLLVGNMRAALITSFTIPISLLLTFISMKWFGVSGNLMSLGALDFGIIVDGAVIVIDNCIRIVHERAKTLGRTLEKNEVREAVFEGAVEIRKAAGFGQLIIVVVFLPIFGLVGIEGKMFRPMAATFTFALLFALVLSFTTVPALASLFFTGDIQDKEPFLMRWLHRIYEPILNLSLRLRLVAVGIGLGAMVIGGLLFTRLGGEFLPQLDEQSLTIQFVRPVNISLDQSVAMQEKSERIVGEFSEVDAIFSRIGTSEIATDPMGVNLSDTYITLKDHSTWPKIEGSKRTKEELVKAISQKLETELPGQRFLFSQPIEMRFNELLEGTRADVSVKVFGEEMNTLVDLTKQIAASISKVKGAGDVEVELRGTSPLLRVTPNIKLLNQLGASNREVLEAVGIAIGGKEAGYLYEGVKRFPIVIRLNEKDRADLNSIRSLPVGISANNVLPLSDTSEIKFVEAYSSVTREQTKRRAAVMINPRDRDTESFVDEAQKRVAQEVKMPSGYYLEWGGNFKNLQEARSRLLVLTPLALALVLLMIYAAFKSGIQTAIIFSGVPLALVGGVLGLMLNGLPFSISAGVGFIALSGIAVLNGVVLLNYFNELKKQGMEGVALVKKGALIRLRPVLMTALVDIFGFLPMMLSVGVGAEVQKPLASVVIGGIVSTTLLTLVILPTLYNLLEQRIARQSTID